MRVPRSGPALAGAITELAVLVVVACLGLMHVEPAHLEPLAPMGYGQFVPAMALIYISYVGFDLITEGHKALVFSQFTQMLGLLKQRLDPLKVNYEYLDGKTRKRQDKVDRFQDDPSIKVFLISLKAGGTGLNLTEASYVFLLDPWWNPAVEAQAIDRTHRIGQSERVHAYRVIARDTIEERVLELQARKRELVDSLIGGAASGLADLTREDLEQLLA